jgi:hypothetical protein
MSNEPDDHAARELELYIDNTEAFYNQKIAVFRNLAKKKDRGKYSPDLAPKAFAYTTRLGAQNYRREHGSVTDSWFRMFTVETRRAVAESFVQEFLDWYQTDWPSR